MSAKQTSESPLVTIILCVYNGGEFLRPSVQSVLDQSYENLEVIVVDDGSTDGCVDTIRDIQDGRIRILSQENFGKPRALNYALAEMRGEYYAIQDADDLSAPDRIEKQLAYLMEHPSVAGVFSGYDLILDGKHVAAKLEAKTTEQCKDDIERGRMPCHDPTAMYRMSAVRDFRYDEDMIVAEGYDYVLRLGERHPLAVLGECLYSYRIEKSTITKRDPRLRQRQMERAVRRMFERRGISLDRMRLPWDGVEGELRPQDLDNNLVAHFMASIVDLRRAKRLREAIHAAWVCWSLNPFALYYCKPWVYVFAPLWLVDRYRASNVDRRSIIGPEGNSPGEDRTV